MDYTKNYHLPQWVDEDRIQRVDFNEAMANIENGLTEARSGRSDLRDSLLRTAYNSWQHLALLPEAPPQDGAFRQGFLPTGSRPYTAKDGTETIQISEGRWLANFDKAPTAQDLQATVKQLSAISYEKNSRKFAMTFTPPYPIIIDRIFAYGSYDRKKLDSANSGARQLGGWTARLYNDITGKLIKEFISKDELFTYESGIGYGFSLDLCVIAHQNVRYRYEIELAEDVKVPCEYDIGAGKLDLQSKPVTLFTTFGSKKSSVTFSGQLPLTGSAGEGLALARYTTQGTEGGVTLNWLGKTLSPDTVRTVTYKGQEVREAVFRLEQPVPADSTMELTVHCGENGEFILLDWGAVAI